MPGPALDTLPGFRRRFRVTPAAAWVRTELEDDMHCMNVTLHHKDGIVTSVEPAMPRFPWNTCPGAIEQLKTTFTGIALKDFVDRGDKPANCTHLHDLAVLGATHAYDRQPLVYDILVSDPIAGRQRTELRRDGKTVMSWELENMRIVAPAEVAGLPLTGLRKWIDSLGPEQQEAARMLRWGTMVSHGRTLPMEEQSDATKMPPAVCYTTQPEMAPQARRVGKIRDFTGGDGEPLDGREQIRQAG